MAMLILKTYGINISTSNIVSRTVVSDVVVDSFLKEKTCFKGFKMFAHLCIVTHYYLEELKTAIQCLGIKPKAINK